MAALLLLLKDDDALANNYFETPSSDAMLDGLKITARLFSGP